MGRLQTWDDQVRAERSKPVAPETDPALLEILGRIAAASERTSRRVCVIELILAVPVLISVLGGAMMLWGFLYR